MLHSVGLACHATPRRLALQRLRSGLKPSTLRRYFGVRVGATLTADVGYLSDDAEWTYDEDYAGRKVRVDPASEAEPHAQSPLPTRNPLPPPRTARVPPSLTSSPPEIITRIPEQLTRTVTSNALLLVDKPPNWDGQDTINSVKYALKMKHVGHAGALDPMATGLVIIALGRACKLSSVFAPLDRTYTGTLKLGISTTTYSSSGKVVTTMPWKHITDAMLQDKVREFQGEILQVPPMWSGVKVAGKPLYKYAERGETIELPPRPAYISSFQVWRLDPSSPDVHFKLVAGPHTNARALAHDFGLALGSAAHVTALRRTAIGHFHVDHAWTMDVLLPLMKKYEKLYRSSASLVVGGGVKGARQGSRRPRQTVRGR